MNRKPKDDSGITAILIIFIILLMGIVGAWWEYSLWMECRQTNSFFYCLRVLGGK